MRSVEAHSPLLNRVLANSSWILIDKFLRILVGLWLTGWMTRVLLPEGFGELQFALTLTGLMSVFWMLGLDSALVRDLSRNSSVEAASLLLGQALLLKLLGACLGISLAMIYTFFAAPSVWLTVLLCVASFLASAFSVLELIFHSRLESRFVVLSRAVGFFVASAFKIYFLLNGYGVPAFAVLVGFEILVGDILIGWAVWRMKVRPRFFPMQMPVLIRLLSEGLPLLGVTLLSMALIRADILLLNFFAPFQKIGIFAISPRIVDMLEVFVAAIVGSFLPVLSNSDEARRKSISESLYQVMVLVGLGCGLGGTLLAPLVIPLLFGEAFREAVLPFQIYVWGFVFSSMNSVRAAILISGHRLDLLFWNQLLATGLGVSLLALAAIGAHLPSLAGALVFSHFLGAFATPLLFRDLRPWVGIQLRAIFLLGLPNLWQILRERGLRR